MSYFGITSNDIVRAFHGTIVSDFETDGESGAEIINRELELAYEEALELIDPTALGMINNGIAPHVVSTCIDASGNRVIDLFGIPEECSIDVRVWEDRQRDYYNDYPLQDRLTGTLGCEPCGFRIEQYEAFTDWTIEGSQLVLGPSYEDNQKLIISYRLENPEDFNLPSIGRYIRNRVACIIGHNLYTAGQDSWALVEQFCKEADKFESKYENKKLVPSELKRLKWMEYPFNTGWGTIKLRRV